MLVTDVAKLGVLAVLVAHAVTIVVAELVTHLLLLSQLTALPVFLQLIILGCLQ